MMDTDSSSGSSDDEIMKDEDMIHMTPQPHKTRFSLAGTASPGMDTMSPFSPALANLLSFQRRLKIGKRDSRKSSSSASRRSSVASPGPSSPPLLKSIESSLSGNYFSRDLTKKDIESRRESLSLGTNDLHITDAPDSDDPERPQIHAVDALGIPIPVTPTLDERRNVIRRAVTRRSNMLVSNGVYMFEGMLTACSQSLKDLHVYGQHCKKKVHLSKTNLDAKPRSFAKCERAILMPTGTISPRSQQPQHLLLAYFQWEQAR
jgi:hypothetical protein